MSAIQSFMLGVMVAWTPGLLLLGFLLWRAPEIEPDAKTN